MARAMLTQANLFAASGLLAALAAASAFAEHRRQKRRNLDSVGWVPWDLIQILAFLLAVVAAALALTADG
jgi:hypothetical protein